MYLTNQLFNELVKYHGDRPPQRHVPRPRRPDAAGHSGPAGARRDIGFGTGRTVRHQRTRDLPASQGAGARRPDRARPRGAMAAMPDRAERAEGRGRLARGVSPALGAAAGSSGGLPTHADPYAATESPDEEAGDNK